MDKKDFDRFTEGSIELGKEALLSKLNWLDYVPEGEFTPADKRRFLAAMRNAYAVLAPLASKYIDGEKQPRAAGIAHKGRKESNGKGSIAGKVRTVLHAQPQAS